MRILLVDPRCGRATIGPKHLGRAEPFGLEPIAGAATGHRVRWAGLQVGGDLDRNLAGFARIDPESALDAGWTL